MTTELIAHARAFNRWHNNLTQSIRAGFGMSITALICAFLLYANPGNWVMFAVPAGVILFLAIRSVGTGEPNDRP